MTTLQSITTSLEVNKQLKYCPHNKYVSEESQGDITSQEKQLRTVVVCEDCGANVSCLKLLKI